MDGHFGAGVWVGCGTNSSSHALWVVLFVTQVLGGNCYKWVLELDGSRDVGSLNPKNYAFGATPAFKIAAFGRPDAG